MKVQKWFFLWAVGLFLNACVGEVGTDGDQESSDLRWRRRWGQQDGGSTTRSDAGITTSDPGSPNPTSPGPDQNPPPPPPPDSQPPPVNPETAADCTTNVQSMLDGAGAGSTVRLPACVYRGTLTVGKSMVIEAEPGAEIRGSDVWSGWSRQGEGWVSSNSVPSFPFSAAPFDQVVAEPRAAWPEQVFIDGAPQVQVGSGSGVGAGQFKLDGARHVVLGSDPSGHRVEVTMRTAWIVVQASDVTIRGDQSRPLKLMHAASNYQHGGLEVYYQDRFTLEYVDAAHAHAANIAIYHGVDHRISHVRTHDAGNAGIDLGANFGGAPVPGMIVEDSEIDHNNIEGFNAGWHGGGLKATVRSNAIYRRNNVHHNSGSGLWTDTRCNGVEFADNRIHDNSGPGIFYEVSDGAKIHGNILYNNNAHNGDNWGWQGSILISTSKNAEVYSNTVAWSGDGISVIWQPMRGDQPSGGVRGNWVHDNTIIQASGTDKYGLAWLQDRSDGTLFSDGSNRGERNAYWFNAPESGMGRFRYDNPITSLGAFNGTQGEEAGRYLSDTERDSILTTNGIPLSP